MNMETGSKMDIKRFFNVQFDQFVIETLLLIVRAKFLKDRVCFVKL